VHSASYSEQARIPSQVLLAGWAEKQFFGVVAIYEDRHQLWGFKPDGTLLRRQLAASRREELAALTGWRARLSFILEVRDQGGRVGRRWVLTGWPQLHPRGA
jgi:hypothetical protein